MTTPTTARYQRVRTVASAIVRLTLAAAIITVLLAVFVFHWGAERVLSASMEPTIATGDLIIAHRPSIADLRVGAIVTVDRGTFSVTHRIVGVTEDGLFVTKGDANDVQDRHAVSATQISGVVVQHIGGPIARVLGVFV